MVKKKGKLKNGLILGAIILTLLVIGFFAFRNVQQTGFMTGEKQLLSFCSTEDECTNYLTEQGMPADYLKANGIKIVCSNGDCYAQK